MRVCLPKLLLIAKVLQVLLITTPVLALDGGILGRRHRPPDPEAGLPARIVRVIDRPRDVSLVRRPAEPPLPAWRLHGERAALVMEVHRSFDDVLVAVRRVLM